MFDTIRMIFLLRGKKGLDSNSMMEENKCPACGDCRVPLGEFERLDDLQYKGLRIIQDTRKFCFGVDAVLLSHFADIKKGDRAVDLGTGTGVLPILLAGRMPDAEIYGMEIQPDMVEMANRSIRLNGLESHVRILAGDLKKAPDVLGKNRFTLVVSNPPYRKAGSGAVNPRDAKAIARHEILCTLDDVLAAASGLLAPGGRLVMIHRADRLTDILTGMRQHRLEPKRIRTVHPQSGKAPNRILVEAERFGKSPLCWLPPLFIYQENGQYTKELMEIYHIPVTEEKKAVVEEKGKMEQGMNRNKTDGCGKDPMGPGMLYLCGTPIGNLEDITLRALRILKEADCIAAEDTRHTLKLLNHYGISKPLISYHEHNRREKGPEIIRRVQQGQKVVVVSDAGMPGISDPGADLSVLAQEAGVPVSILPGPSASLSALVLSGLPAERFVFEGFLPREGKERRTRIQLLRGEERTVILYEAPHRLISLLNDLLAELGDRRITIVRELTKIHEEVLPMTLAKAVDYYKGRVPKGEFVVILEGVRRDSRMDFSRISIEDHLKEYLRIGMDKKEAVKQVARDRHIPKSEVYPFGIGL